jgi:hypothetical protein
VRGQAKNYCERITEVDAGESEPPGKSHLDPACFAERLRQRVKETAETDFAAAKTAGLNAAVGHSPPFESTNCPNRFSANRLLTAYC